MTKRTPYSAESRRHALEIFLNSAKWLEGDDEFYIEICYPKTFSAPTFAVNEDGNYEPYENPVSLEEERVMIYSTIGHLDIKYSVSEADRNIIIKGHLWT